jgi:dihydrofolate synthase/folylpolyglutamate synthase
MDYREAEEYLHRFVDFEVIPGISFASSDYDLQHVEGLLHRMGDPHLAARTVHIAGTKGKGSTAAMIAQVLTVSGYRTGLYTSPHLHSIRERLKVDGDPISQLDFASLVAEARPHLESVNRSPVYRQPTFFEVLTALAFAYFKRKRVDFQVLETGLGGRLDATNVSSPEVCVITPISLDHTEVLGNSLAKIAYEKAGIIKPRSVVVVSPQPEEVDSLVRDVCCEKGAKLVRVADQLKWHRVACDFHYQSFVVEGKTGSRCFTIPLLGDYQIDNAATAVVALEALASSGFEVSDADIAEGLAKTDWPGRFQVVRRQPTVLVDGAHNVASAIKLVENIKGYFHYNELFLIVGISCDKDVSGVVKALACLSGKVVVTRSSHPRSASPMLLASEFAKCRVAADIAENVPQALSQTLSLANDDDLICVAGSLFVVAEALEYAARHL